MDKFIIIFLTLYYILLILYLTYRKREKNDLVVQFKKRFLLFYIIASLLLSLILVIPLLFGKLPSVYTVLIVIILLGVCFFCVMWYKNFYISYDENYFIYNNFLNKKYKIQYKEVKKLDTNSDIIIFEAKGKSFFVINNKKFVNNINEFINILKTKNK